MVLEPIATLISRLHPLKMHVKDLKNIHRLQSRDLTNRFVADSIG